MSIFSSAWWSAACGYGFRTPQCSSESPETPRPCHLSSVYLSSDRCVVPCRFIRNPDGARDRHRGGKVRELWPVAWRMSRRRIRCRRSCASLRHTSPTAVPSSACRKMFRSLRGPFLSNGPNRTVKPEFSSRRKPEAGHGPFNAYWPGE
jgi:hypothetical protein